MHEYGYVVFYAINQDTGDHCSQLVMVTWAPMLIFHISKLQCKQLVTGFCISLVNKYASLVKV